MTAPKKTVPPGGRKAGLGDLRSAARAAADILGHLAFVDEDDAEHARQVLRALRAHLKSKGGAR